MHQTAWVISVTLMSITAAVFVWVVLSTRNPADDHGPIVAAAYSFRKIFFGALLAVTAIATLTTLGGLPYAIAAQDEGIQVVNASGYQWYWELDRSEVKTGQPVQFRVDAADVTHGFGVYDADLQLVVQTQAMPGYTAIVNYTFDKPGVYRILCLEYCGVSHHIMMAELTVTN